MTAVNSWAISGEDSKIENDHPFTRSIDSAYLQHWLPPRRTRRLCNCAATPRRRKCVAPGRSRACATIDPWLGSLEEEVKTMRGRARKGEIRQGDDGNADNLVGRASKRVRPAINLATRGVDLLTYSPFNLLCSEESEGNRTSGNSLSKG